MKSKHDFLIHEIGTPLGIIRGRAELLLTSSSASTKKTAQIIVDQVDRISELINELKNEE